MNTYKRIGIIAALAAICTVAFASSKDEQAIRKTYDKLVSAMKSKSISKIEALEAPNYSESMKGKSYTRDEANKMMSQEFGTVKQFNQFDLRITSIKISGSTATAKTTVKFSGVVNYQGKSHALEVTGGTVDTLTKTPKGWLFMSSKDVDNRVKVDGKEMPG